MERLDHHFKRITRAIRLIDRVDLVGTSYWSPIDALNASGTVDPSDFAIGSSDGDLKP